jgi:hypothetical protein
MDGEQLDQARQYVVVVFDPPVERRDAARAGFVKGARDPPPQRGKGIVAKIEARAFVHGLEQQAQIVQFRVAGARGRFIRIVGRRRSGVRGIGHEGARSAVQR